MSTVISSELSASEALKGSLSFVKEFVSRHWLLVIVYSCLAVAPNLIFNSETQSLVAFLDWRFYLWALVFGVPSWLMIYFAIKMSLARLDPSLNSNKSLLQSLWQIICLDVLRSVVFIILMTLFIIPGIWWLTKTSLCWAILLSTNSGPIQSIRKSHELINNKFWLCFKYWFIITIMTMFYINVPVIVLLVIYAISMQVMGHGLNAQSFTHTFGLLSSVLGVFGHIIFLFCQTWLYLSLIRHQSTTVSRDLSENQ